MGSLQQTILDDMKVAMREKAMQRLTTIRMLRAEIKQIEIDQKTVLTDTSVISLIQKMIKKRQSAAIQFQDANRQDLVDKENQEITILTQYLPKQLDENEISSIIDKTIATLKATSMKEMGVVMNQLKQELQGKADTGIISRLVKQKLSS